jgi:hypothetical protein
MTFGPRNLEHQTITEPELGALPKLIDARMTGNLEEIPLRMLRLRARRTSGSGGSRAAPGAGATGAIRRRQVCESGSGDCAKAASHRA